MYVFFLKRPFDLVVASVALFVLMPVFFLISILILSLQGRPIFFSQMRGGLHGRPIRIWKFCSMKDVKGGDGGLLPDQYRITKLGAFLRKTSLDELPSLVNVLRGDICLVGPRPLLFEYVALYDEAQARRLAVRPGITGWAQINGRNAIEWEEKFKLDVWYVEHQSFVLDLKILFLTVKKVLFKEGVNASGEVTMPRFTGNRDTEKK